MRGLAGSGVLAAGLLVGAADSAAARPTLWDVARDPGVRVVEVRRVAAERILTREINSPQALLSAQRAAAELFSRLSGDGAALEADTGLLALLVGLIYSQPYVVDSVAARRWFERALTGELPPPLAAVALARLGDALFAVGDMAEAAAAHSAALELATDPDERARLWLNRGEARMGLGELRGAIADFERAWARGTRPELRSLAAFGLGVALERSGDLPAALQSMRAARAAWMPQASYSALDLPGVFFVPAFERHYYRGLDALAQAGAAREMGDIGLVAAAQSASCAHFAAYLREAEPAAAPWVGHARVHARRCREERPDAVEARPSGVPVPR